MIARQQMDKKRWSIAHDIASDLVDRDTDLNEFGKVVAFVRRYRDDNNAKQKLISLVQRMADSDNALIRSRQTQGYYQKIQHACKKHLRNIDKTEELLLILGWSMRLMRYHYSVEPKRDAKKQHASRSNKVAMQKSRSTKTPSPKHRRSRKSK